MNKVTKIQDKIPVKRVLVSLSNKDGLEDFVNGVLKNSPSVVFYSSTGTYKAIKGFLGELAETHLVEVADFTGYDEMPGGLVKTLHPMVHAGLLGERLSEEHQEYLEVIGSDYFDLIVCNLYPFEDTVSNGGTFEEVRGNIDVGGPTMIRAGAKNWQSCGSVCNPDDYSEIIEELSNNSGCTTLETRFRLMKSAFEHTDAYDAAISRYMNSKNFDDVIKEYIVHS